MWSRLMLIAIGGRGKLDHLEGEVKPPQPYDTDFKSWQESDYVVFSWLVQNMEQRLVMQFAQHKTAKAMWKSLVTTFGIRVDPIQVYDIEVRTNKLAQGNDTLENYWAELQNLWVNSDSRKPCPYTCCEKGTNIYRKETEIKRLYQFLSGLNDKYDGIRREILKLGETSAEDAFGIVKMEEERTGIWRSMARVTDPESAGIGAGFGARQGPQPQYSQPYRAAPPPPPPHHRNSPTLPPRGYPPNRKHQIDKSKLFCTHCGMTKHTKETCFKLVEFPDGGRMDTNKIGSRRPKGNQHLGERRTTDLPFRWATKRPPAPETAAA